MRAKAIQRSNTQPVRWTADLDALLGTRPDREVAAAAGCSGEAVRRRRLALGVGPCRPERPWTAKALALLGTAPDSVIAARLGISRVAVRIARHRHGIAAFQAK